jgi:UDP-3-O-[3-hydroxymyristoyl] glucosamine N-acyltransferase
VAFGQIRENARLGSDCIVGRGAYVGPGVAIGDQVELQNYALVYEPARLEGQLHRARRRPYE